MQLHGRNGKGQSGTKSSLIASLDIGSTKICCLIAERQPQKSKTSHDVRSSLKVIGFGQTAARGVRAGAIVDVQEAECAIRLAVDAAERMAEKTISEVYVGVNGGRPQTTSVSGRVATQTGVVSPRDVEYGVSQALSRVNVGKRSILHLSLVNHTLDGVSNIASPLGLHGEALQVDVGLTTVEPGYLRNLELAISRAHLNVAGFVMAPYAAAKAVLTADEMALGTLIIDFGGALTSFAYVRDNQLVAADSVTLGSLHVTNDIAQGLSTTLAHAERMKTLWGSVLPDGHAEREMLAVPLLGERGVDSVHKVPKSHLTNILRARVEEIVEHVKDKLAASSFASLRPSRLVLTGGGSQLSGMRELVSAMLNVPARLGQSTGFAAMPETARQSGFGVAAGTLCYAAQPDAHYQLPMDSQAQFQRAQMGYIRRVGHWLAEAL